jgi:hypothetical protein
MKLTKNHLFWIVIGVAALVAGLNIGRLQSRHNKQLLQADLSRVIVNEKDYNGGTAWRTVLLRNTDPKRDIRIIEVASGCGCAKVEVDKKALRPGDTSRLSFAIDAGSDTSGSMSTSVAIAWESDKIKRQLLEIPIELTYKNQLVIFPSEIFISKTRKDEVIIDESIILCADNPEQLAAWELYFLDLPVWLTCYKEKSEAAWRKFILRVNRTKLDVNSGRFKIPLTLRKKNTEIEHLRSIEILLEG